ncbi:MAG: carboxypeptidase regulatory-like domain-containing protein [Acidobacteria bacterium]|nr:carboxypeptidase regulatory-like domain-containing protein [Acidobacteriota bacterium]
MKHLRLIWILLTLGMLLSIPPSNRTSAQESAIVQEAAGGIGTEHRGSAFAIPSQGVTITAHKMTDVALAGDCTPPPAKFNFATTDPIAYQWTAASGARAGDVVQWEWMTPSGSLYRTDQLTFSLSGQVCFSAGLIIAGQSPATLVGEWRVNLLYNGTRVLIERFTIGTMGGLLCSKPVQSFFDGLLGLGSASARAACAPPGLLDASTAALMADDLRHTATGLELASPCVEFDLSRVTTLERQITTLTAEQAARELNQLAHDVLEAVRRAGLRSNQVGPGAFEQFTEAALAMGSITTRATCFSCQNPLPAPTVDEIKDALANAQQRLLAYASCIPGFDFASFDTRRVGAPTSAVQTSYDVIALSTDLRIAICNSDCCFTCSRAPAVGSVQGTVRNASNNQPIAGATILVANRTTTSRSDGAYTLSDVPAGQQPLTAFASGFMSTQLTVTVIANQTVTQDISLVPLPTQTGTVQGSVRNASSGQPISGATISAAGRSTTSGGDGTYTLSDVPAGQQPLTASATGFITTQVTVTVMANQTVTQNISLSPILQTGQIRITLNWTKNASGAPDDLDMHLTGPEPDGASCFHIFFLFPGSLDGSPFAQLEVDNIELPDHPPTETIRISRLTPGIYRFYVHNFGALLGGEPADGLSQSRATVQVFSSSGLLFSQTVPAGSGLFWNVFTLNGQTGQITPVNQLTNTPPPETCR